MLCHSLHETKFTYKTKLQKGITNNITKFSHCCYNWKQIQWQVPMLFPQNDFPSSVVGHVPITRLLCNRNTMSVFFFPVWLINIYSIWRSIVCLEQQVLGSLVKYFHKDAGFSPRAGEHSLATEMPASFAVHINLK